MHAKVDAAAAEVVVPSPQLEAGIDFFVAHGFRIDQIFPADDPTTARLSGHGIALRLERDVSAPSPQLRLTRSTSATEAKTAPQANATATGPNGTVIDFRDRDEDQMLLPDLQPSFSLSRASESALWHTGRAGMHYRDLIPDRQGGRFVASHIRIIDGGPVPDYVHHHDIRFQMIYCHRGWVDVVYEDQGSPFRLIEGDCVLQPPGIRHRVLESSAGCEVVEIGCPAVHPTSADHELTLPTPTLRPNRDFGGQRFVRHHAADAPSKRAEGAFWSARDTGISAATDGLASVQILHSPEGSDLASIGQADHEFLFHFVVSGTATLHVDRPASAKKTANAAAAEMDSVTAALEPGDAFCVPAGMSWQLSAVSAGCQLLEVALPARG